MPCKRKPPRRKQPSEAEREMIQEEAAPILSVIKELRAEVAELRAELARRETAGR